MFINYLRNCFVENIRYMWISIIIAINKMYRNTSERKNSNDYIPVIQIIIRIHVIIRIHIIIMIQMNLNFTVILGINVIHVNKISKIIKKLIDYLINHIVLYIVVILLVIY